MVAEKQVVDLPLNGRNFTQLLSLSPGVAPVSVSQNSGGFGNVASGTLSSSPSINGQTNRSNFFMTDGLNNQGAFQSTYAVPPIIDAMSEFKVNAHNDQAEFGGALGGIINVVTKSGTNQLHGSSGSFCETTHSTPATHSRTAVTVFRQNQYGASAGGPVIFPKLYNGRNKTFFFGAYQGFQYSRAANAFLHLPTDPELSGNLAGQAQAFNPFTTRPDPNTRAALFAILSGQSDSRKPDRHTVREFCQDNSAAAGKHGVANNNAVDNTPFRQHQNEFTARIDQKLGAKDFLWFRYSALYYDTSGSGGIPGYVQTITDNPGQNYGASWVHTFSPGLILQAQYGRSHQETNSFNCVQQPAARSNRRSRLLP